MKKINNLFMKKKTRGLHVQHIFYILHFFDLHGTFMEDVKTLLNLHRVLLKEFSSMKNCLRLTNWAGLNKCDRVWKNAKSFFCFLAIFQCGRRLMIANEIANIYHYWRLEKSRGLFINKTRKKFKAVSFIVSKLCGNARMFSLNLY